MAYLVAACRAVTLFACSNGEEAPVNAQSGVCADWNTEAIFEIAEVSDVTRCLQEGADLKAQGGVLSETPLHMATRLGTAEIVAALLDAGCITCGENAG